MYIFVSSYVYLIKCGMCVHMCLYVFNKNDNRCAYITSNIFFILLNKKIYPSNFLVIT